MIDKQLKMKGREWFIVSNDIIGGNFYAFTSTSIWNSTRSKIAQGKIDSKEPRALTMDKT